jgi:Na+/H+-dicarboxylate symporter
MEKLERLGCSKPVVGLVVPTGYSFNLDGTNIYMTLATLFIAQALGVDLTLGQQITILVVAMLTSKGASGVTGAGFITLAATLAVVNPALVPGMAIVLGIDKFMSECRALTNITATASPASSCRGGRANSIAASSIRRSPRAQGRPSLWRPDRAAAYRSVIASELILASGESR